MRIRPNRRILIGATIGLTLGWLAGGKYSNAQSRTDPIIGTWKVTVEPDEDGRRAGAKPYEDTLTVKPDYTFSSAVQKKAGFKDDRADVDTRPFAPAQWNVTIKNEKTGDAIKYQGTADGQETHGTIVVTTKKTGATSNYTFKGEPKKDKK